VQGWPNIWPYANTLSPYVNSPVHLPGPVRMFEWYRRLWAGVGRRASRARRAEQHDVLLAGHEGGGGQDSGEVLLVGPASDVGWVGDGLTPGSAPLMGRHQPPCAGHEHLFDAGMNWPRVRKWSRWIAPTARHGLDHHHGLAYSATRAEIRECGSQWDLLDRAGRHGHHGGEGTALHMETGQRTL